MAPVLNKRLLKGSRLTAGEFDDNMSNIEAAFAVLEAAIALIQSGGDAPTREVDLRDYSIDFTGDNDSTTPTVTALLDAYTNGYPCVAPAGDIRVSTLRLPTRVEFKGAGVGHTRIRSDGSNAPILKSKNMFTGDAQAGNMQGRCRVHDMRFIGSNDQTKSAQHGIVLRDFFSEIYDCEFEGCSGSAVVMTQLNDAGVSTAVGVNNQVRDCQIYQNRGLVALQLGNAGATAMTDGLLSNVYVNTARTGSNAGYEPVVVANAAGWMIDRVHTYSYHPTVTGLVNPHTAVHLVKPYHTKVRDLYVEQWTNAGMYVEGGALLHVQGMSAICETAIAAATALYVDGSATLGNPVVDLQGLGLSKATGTQAIFAVTAANNASVNVASAPSREGARLADITLYRELTGGNLFAPNGAGGWVGIVP